MDLYKKDFIGRLYKYSLTIVRFVEKIPYSRTGQIIVRQLVRSATSVTANVVEAVAASSRKDYIKFYFYALKSANESKYWLCLLKDSGKVSVETVDPLIKEADEISKILGASVVTLKKKINL